MSHFLSITFPNQYFIFLYLSNILLPFIPNDDTHIYDLELLHYLGLIPHFIHNLYSFFHMYIINPRVNLLIIILFSTVLSEYFMILLIVIYSNFLSCHYFFFLNLINYMMKSLYIYLYNLVSKFSVYEIRKNYISYQIS